MDNALSLVEQVAEFLLSGVPEMDRAAASAVVRGEILPLRRRSLQECDGTDSLQVVLLSYFDGLRYELARAQPEARLGVLRAGARSFLIQDLESRSLAMAKARYLREHPDLLVACPQEIIGDRAAEMLTWSAEQMDAEAARMQEQLERWREAEWPPRSRPHKERYHSVRGNLHTARTGDFEAITEGFYRFLKAAGVPVATRNWR